MKYNDAQAPKSQEEPLKEEGEAAATFDARVAVLCLAL